MKNNNSWQSKVSLIFVLLLLTLLPTLALLQYRWLGQVSIAEHNRMQSSLRSAASNFTKDFDREISSIFFSLHISNKIAGTQKDNNDSLDRYVEVYQKWLNKTKHPKLIKGLYVLDNNQVTKEMIVLKFLPEDNYFKPSELPVELKSLREKLNQNYRVDESNETKGSNSLKSKQLSFQADSPIASDIPAVVISSFNPDNIQTIDLRGPNPDVLLSMKASSKYLVALLDLSYIKEQFLPSLTKEYFSDANQLDYNIAVINPNNADELIYQSSPEIKKDILSNSDTKISFFSINPEEFEKFVFFGASPEVMPFNTIVKQETESKEKSSNKVSGQTITQHVENKTHKATISIVQSTTVSSKPLNPTEIKPNIKVLRIEKDKEVKPNTWQLIVKHRSGSLDVAVSNLRQRNLAISFGILLVLGFSMGMLLISTRRAQSLAKQQMEFVAGVSHELRTPLAVICSAGENLADGVVHKPEQIKRYGSLIKGEGRRLSDMVEQILEFAGWQSHRKTYHLQPTNISNIIESAISACSILISETNTEVVKEVEPNLPLIDADIAALERAIQNLISNAIKYSTEVKWVKITANFHPKLSQVEVNIIDKGIGISSKELPFIFEPFYRGQDVIDAQIHGSGLGLSLVKQIVTACGGKVSVSSSLNQGSTFTLFFPLSKSKQLETVKGTKETKEIYE